MKVTQLLEDLNKQGVEIWQEGGRLHYRAPKTVMNETLIAELSDKKHEIISVLRDRKKDFEIPEIVPDPQQLHQPFPLTDLQGAYIAGRSKVFKLGNVACHLYFELESKNLDIERLTSAWQHLIEHHDMLRAVFQSDGTQQILKQVSPYKIKILDLIGKAPDIVKSWLKDIRNSMSHQVFKTDQWPLFEFQATLLDDNLIRLHISIDLLITDFYSTQILLKELLELYNSPERPLVPLEVSFRDYVLAEANLRDSELYNRSRNYWLNRLYKLPPAPVLPLKKNPGSIAKPRFVRRDFQLKAETWLCLKNRASRAGVTPSVVLLAVYADVLSTWSKSPNFTINLTLFNRLPLHSQIMDIVGDFTSVSLLEVDNSSQDSFEGRVRHLQRQLWDDMDHYYFSGVQVMRELNRRKGRTAENLMHVVFSSTVGLEASSQNKPDLTTLGKIIYTITQTPQVWIDHQVREQDEALIFSWDAVEELFPDGLLDDMFDAYCHLLQRLADDEEAWQETTRQLIPAAQIERRATVNATEAPVSSDMLHTLFNDQVHQRPDHPAVVCSKRTLSYEELSDCSNQVGRLLREKGVQPNTLIAVVMEKGWEQVVAVLGILNSGAAYLPIDPTVPKERLCHLLENGEVSLLLTQSWLEERLEWPKIVQRFSVDTMDLTDKDDRPLDPLQRPEDLAYVIYTSGSTGLPKGVMIDHRGAVNTILDVNKRFGIDSEDRMLALSNLNFDLSVYDIFGTLAAGGTIVLPEADRTKDPGHWLELITQEQVTVWNSVPALMQMIVEYTSGRSELVSQSLRLVLLSGDWIPLDLPDQIKALIDDVQVISLGGATEASIWSNLYPIEEVDPEWKSIPYGRSMVNQRFYVLNELMENCPDWVLGQLYIGGIGLAKGYWRDEEKTRDSFIIHPRTKERLYCTGDLGRYLPDGNIEFLGREDLQVKIRGYRIELGEIEAALKQHPGVRDAVVTAVGNPQGDKRLVGYIVPDQKNASSLFDAENADPAELEIFWDSLVEAGRLQSKQWNEKIDLLTLSNSWNHAERQSIAYMCRALRDLGVFISSQEKHSIDDLMRQCQIHPGHQRLLLRWLKVLEKEGLLQGKGKETFVSLQPLPSNILGEGEILQYQNSIEHEDDVPYYVRYIKRSSENLTGLLRGEVDPLNLFFPKGSWETAESIYQFNPVSQYHNSVISEIMKSIVIGWPTAKQLRILEVGAGIGGTTSKLLPVLPPDRTIYTYTDISIYFTNQAKNKFKDYQFVQYGLLDLNSSPQDQGYALHNFDVIISGGVLHSTRNIETTLQRLRSLLSPNGLILISEVTRDSSLLMLTMEFIAGLNDFEDEERVKDNTPFLSVEKWSKALLSKGFEKVAVFPESGHPTEVFGQHVMLSQSSSSVNKEFCQAILQNFLYQKLPNYMVPSQYIPMDTLPLTHSGKVDRQALPIPGDKISSEMRKTYVAPRNVFEEKLVKIWEQILNVDQVGVCDNFFELGGDSLLMVQLASKMDDKFGDDIDVDLTMRSLLVAPTIAELVERIQKNREKKKTVVDIDKDRDDSPLVAMKSKGTLLPFFCIHDGTGTVFPFRHLSYQFDIDRPLYGIQVHDTDKYHKHEPDTLIETLALEYIKAIQMVQAEGPYLIGGYCMGGLIAFEMAHQLLNKGQKVAELIIISSFKPSFFIDDNVILPYMFASNILDLPREEKSYLDFGKLNEFEFRNVLIEGSDSTRIEAEDICKVLASDKKYNSIASKYRKLEKMNFDERLTLIFDVARSTNQELNIITFNHFKDMFNLYKRSFNGVMRYQIHPYSGSLVLFKPSDEEYPLLYKTDIISVWENMTNQRLRVYEIPGKHQTCFEEPNIRFLAKKLNEILSESGF